MASRTCSPKLANFLSCVIPSYTVTSQLSSILHPKYLETLSLSLRPTHRLKQASSPSSCNGFQIAFHHSPVSSYLPKTQNPPRLHMFDDFQSPATPRVSCPSTPPPCMPSVTLSPQLGMLLSLPVKHPLTVEKPSSSQAPPVPWAESTAPWARGPTSWSSGLFPSSLTTYPTPKCGASMARCSKMPAAFDSTRKRKLESQIGFLTVSLHCHSLLSSQQILFT